jgi:DNA invertase Pin-like site-specific DNA recombinase
MWVLHRCDNPPCQNPAHWFLGTPGDNNKDRDAKGRTAKWARNGGAILTEDEVREVRRLLAKGIRDSEVAIIFGMTKTTIGSIKRGQTWTGMV